MIVLKAPQQKLLEALHNDPSNDQARFDAIKLSWRECKVCKSASKGHLMIAPCSRCIK